MKRREGFTEEQLNIWFKELQKYEIALKKWDEKLQEWEDGLEIMADVQALSTAVKMAEPPEDVSWQELLLEDMEKIQNIINTDSSVDWLENLYKLRDRRRKKK